MNFSPFVLCSSAVAVCRYELGAALFIGWAGSVLCILGGSMLCFSIAGTKRSVAAN